MKQIEKVDIFLYIFVMCYILKMKLNFIWKNINSIYNFNIHHLIINFSLFLIIYNKSTLLSKLFNFFYQIIFFIH